MQTIYYPGFTIGGIFEPLAAVATFILLLLTPTNSTPFWLVVTAFLAILAMHAVFWFVTQPANRYWLKNQQLGRVGAKFFSVPTQPSGTTKPDKQAWTSFRDQWEYSHVIRAVLSCIAMISLLIAITS